MLQVECDVPGGISLVVLNYREADGGWLQLSPTQVAGSAAIDSVEIRQTPLAVRRSLYCCWVVLLGGGISSLVCCQGP